MPSTSKLADSSGKHADGTRGERRTTRLSPGARAVGWPSTAKSHVEFPGIQADRLAVAFWMRSGAMPEMTVLEGGPGFEIGVEDSHPQPDFKRGSPLYVEWRGRR